MNFTSPDHSKKLIVLAMGSGLIAGIISSARHWYGTMVYASPWRASVSYWIMSSVLIVYSLLFIYWKNKESLQEKNCLMAFSF